MAPELEALRAQNASLDQQLEVQTKRIAEVEKALAAAQRAAHRQAKCHWPPAPPASNSDPELWPSPLISIRLRGFPCANHAPFCAIVSASSSAPAACLRPLIGSLLK